MAVDIKGLVVKVEQREQALLEVQIRAVALQDERVETQMMRHLGDPVVLRRPLVVRTAAGGFVICSATCCSELIEETATEYEGDQPAIDAGQTND